MNHGVDARPLKATGRAVTYNTLTQFIGKLVGFVISSFSIVIIAQHLGTIGLGHYATVTAFVGFFLSVAELGFNYVMIREIAQNTAEREAITGRYLGLRLVWGAVVFGLSVPVAALLPDYRGVVVVGVGIFAINQFILSINQVFVNLLQIDLRMDLATLAEVVNRAVSLGLYVWFAKLAPSATQFFYAILWISVVAALLNAVLTYVFVTQKTRLRPSFDIRSWSPIFRAVAPVTVFNFLMAAHFKADTIILSLLRSPYDVGVYGYAYKIVEILFTVPIMFVGLFYPYFSVLAGESKTVHLRQLAQKTFTTMVIWVTPFIALIYLMAPYLTVFLARESVADGRVAGHVLQILSLAMVGWFFGVFFQQVLLAMKQNRRLITSVAVVVGLNVAANVVFVPRYSYYAASVITVVTETSLMLLMVYACRATLDFRPKMTYAPFVIAATGVMLLVGWALRGVVAPLEAFGTASRLAQLVTLAILFVGSGAAYALVLLLGGKRSPLRYLAEVARHG